MSDIGISSAAPPIQAPINTQLRQPSATAQAAAVKSVGAATGQIAATLAAISSGLNIQV